MRKVIYISVLLMVFSVAAAAQKVIYEDTSLLQKDEPVVAPPVVDEEIKPYIDTVQETAAADSGEENIDTVLHKNNLRMSFDSVRNWQNLREYAYTKYLDSLLKNQKVEKTAEPTEERPGFLNALLNTGFVRVLLWTLAIGFVLFIVYRLFLAEGVFQRKSKSLSNEEAEAREEEITGESDFDALIRAALQSGNYRQAVRYQYLRTLHRLADKQIIELAPDKTNFQYVHEIANQAHQQDFASLTLNYEYVWYGEFAIEKDIYQKIETGFAGFNQKL